MDVVSERCSELMKLATKMEFNDRWKTGITKEPVLQV